MDSRQEIIYQLYETRGEYYDMAADAAINERPFYMQKELDDINDQIKALETAVPIDTRWLLTGVIRHSNPALLGRYVPTDPRTPAEREWDEAGEDWNRQMKELLG